VSECILGVDIGGTKVAAAVVSAEGDVLHRIRVPMRADGSAEDAIGAVFEAIDGVRAKLNGARITGIGISSPGPLDTKNGVVLRAPNLPCWRNYPLRDAVESHYNVPARLENDANAAGLAEAAWGAGAGHKYVLYATLGTGIGTAIVIDKRLYLGRTGAAAEAGHMTIDRHGEVRCGCGKPGCIEGLAAGPAVAARALQKLSRPSNYVAASALPRDAERLTAEEVVKAWRAADPIAIEVINETVEALGIWFGNLIDVLEPNVIVVGGGLGSALQSLLPTVCNVSAKWTVNPRAREIPFVPAYFAEDAGIVGSAALWLDNSKVLTPTK
jgi:glucokinase